MLVGTNLKYANSYNNRIIVETIRLYGPLSRVDIARRTQLTAQTVTNITKKLMDAGLVMEDSRNQTGRGAPSILLKLNETAAFSLGIDFDKDHMTVVMLNLNGKICRSKYMVMNYPYPDEAIDRMCESVEELIDEEGIEKERIWGVGVAVPGPMATTEGSPFANVANPQALPGWDNVPVVKQLEDRLELPVVLENNASAAAMGEHWYGRAKHIRSFFYVYFGAGLGGGLVINGQLYSGQTGNAGELGYFPTQIFKDSENGYEHDHLGGFFNIPKLQKKMRDAGYPTESLSELDSYFKNDNPVLREWLDTGSRFLGPLILAIEYLIDPEVIYFGGRLPDSMLKTLLGQLEATLPTYRIERKLVHPEFKIASAGIDAAALGVATLPLYTSFAPLPRLLMKKNNQKTDTFARSYDHE